MKSKIDNIAEYILYLWQMEDVIRACPEMVQSNPELAEIEAMMRSEGVLEKGHIQLAVNALSEMEDLHAELYETEAPYHSALLKLQPSLNLLKAKTFTPTMSDIEMMFVFLHGIMMLHLQHKEISADTQALQQQITSVLSFLSRIYRDDDQTTI